MVDVTAVTAVIAVMAVTASFMGRMKLRIGVPGAKLHEEADFEVQKCLAPQKHGQTCETLIFRPENFAEKKFSPPKNETWGIV